MGSDFTKDASKQDIINELVAKLSPIEKKTVGNNLWMVVQRKNGERTILLAKLSKLRDFGWGYWLMGEEEGPYACNCPLSFLDLVTAPTGHAVRWRQRVREHHSAVAGKREVPPRTLGEFSPAEWREIRAALEAECRENGGRLARGEVKRYMDRKLLILRMGLTQVKDAEGRRFWLGEE